LLDGLVLGVYDVDEALLPTDFVLVHSFVFNALFNFMF